MALGFFGLVTLTQTAAAQSSCSSDGLPPPTALAERFVSADCESCWSDPQTHLPHRRELAIDWIVPSPKGDDAPLSAAASRDATGRLDFLSGAAQSAASSSPGPTASRYLHHKIQTKPIKLRVARGIAFGGYMGASIELVLPSARKTEPPQAMTAWLLLVENIPQGTNGTPVPRNLVRNVIMFRWDPPNLLSNEKQTKPLDRYHESRPMSIPAGANPDRLQVMGWVEDATGQVMAGAVSACLP